MTHRAAWSAEHGEIDPDLVIDHLCRVRACANPAHLEQVTTRVNLLRGIGFVADQARRTHCPRHHELTEDNTYRRPDGSNHRECLQCRRSARRRARETLSHASTQ